MGSAHDSRDRVLAAIANSAAPTSIEEICEETGLHPNTVRGHLDVLLATGAISRESLEAKTRGRPKWLYQVAESTPSPFQFLAEALTDHLANSSEPSLASAAAERWAHAVPELAKASTPDEAVSEAVDALNRLGFEAESNKVGDEITVTTCPYANVVDDNPVVCEIHAALISKLLKQTGQPVSITSLDVWAGPDMCVARLKRPDTAPSRTITFNDKGIINAAEEVTS